MNAKNLKNVAGDAKDDAPVYFLASPESKEWIPVGCAVVKNDDDVDLDCDGQPIPNGAILIMPD